MSVPSTNGVLRTSLSGMNIGDYITCEYSNTVNTIGAFTGNLFGNAKGLVTELGTIPAAITTALSGIFYFLKADSGLLIADRMIVCNVSAQTLNLSNYVLGASQPNKSMIRVLSRAEFLNYITNGDLNGSITKQDPNAWHGTTGTAPEVTTSTYCEINQDRSGSSVMTSLFMDGTTYNSTYNAYYYNSGNLIPIMFGYATANIVVDSVNNGACFRPVLEFVDNTKSTNYFY